MTRRARWIVATLAVLAVLVVVACEILVRMVAVPTFTNCSHKGTYIAIHGFHDAEGDRTNGCHAGAPFTPVVERRGRELTIAVPRDAAEAFATRATLQVIATRLDHADQPTLARLIDLLAPFSHFTAEASVGEPDSLELSLPDVIVDDANPRLELDASQLEDDVELTIVARSQQRA